MSHWLVSKQGTFWLFNKLQLCQISSSSYKRQCEGKTIPFCSIQTFQLRQPHCKMGACFGLLKLCYLTALKTQVIKQAWGHQSSPSPWAFHTGASCEDNAEPRENPEFWEAEDRDEASGSLGWPSLASSAQHTASKCSCLERARTTPQPKTRQKVTVKIACLNFYFM